MTQMPDWLWIDEVGSIDNLTHQYIRADLVPQWQPIETAPKDGAQILVEVMKGYYQVVSFRDGQWRENTNSMALRKPFLRWVTIPKMPE